MGSLISKGMVPLFRLVCGAEPSHILHQAQQMQFEDGGTSIPFLKNSRRVLSGKVTGILPKPEEFIRWHLVDLAQ